MCAGTNRGQKRASDPPAARVRGDCELPNDGYWEPNSSPVEEQQFLSTTEPYLKPCTSILSVIDGGNTVKVLRFKSKSKKSPATK